MNDKRGCVLFRIGSNRATAMFDDMDRNHDGVVDVLEFQAVMQVVAARSGREYSFETVRRMFTEADCNGDGYIDYDEWMSVQKMQKARRLGLASASSRRDHSRCASCRDSSGEDAGAAASPLPAGTQLPPVAAPPGVSGSSSVTTKAALRNLLASLCENGAAEAGVVDRELAAEAEWL